MAACTAVGRCRNGTPSGHAEYRNRGRNRRLAGRISVDARRDVSARRGRMAASRRNDRLAPPLMYAFRAAHRERDAAAQVDVREGGERVLASRRVSSRTPISESELRKIVNSDLVALLNTINLDSAEDLSEAPEVGKSILNFGFPDLARRSIDENAVLRSREGTRDGAARLRAEARAPTRSRRGETTRCRRTSCGCGFSSARSCRMQPVERSGASSSRRWSSTPARSRSTGSER